MPWVGCGWQKKCCPRSESNWGTHHAHSYKQNTITTTPCNLPLTFPFNDICLATWLQQPFPAHLFNLLVELIICTVVVLAALLVHLHTVALHLHRFACWSPFFLKKSCTHRLLKIKFSQYFKRAKLYCDALWLFCCECNTAAGVYLRFD